LIISNLRQHLCCGLTRRDDVAYNETLAERVREIAAGLDGEITERKMFGGLAFMLNGHMFTGVVGEELMLRLGEPGAEAALRREHVREMDFTGRTMKAMVFIEPAGLEGTALNEWLTSAAAFAMALPPK
jgi:TfoX N-terminal domain